MAFGAVPLVLHYARGRNGTEKDQGMCPPSAMGRRGADGGLAWQFAWGPYTAILRHAGVGRPR